HPGGNLRTPFETASMLPDVKKHVARNVLGGGRLVHEPQHETVHPHMMARIEDFHRESVAGGDASDEPFIGTGVVPAGAMGGKLCKRRTISYLTSPRVSERTREWPHRPSRAALSGNEVVEGVNLEVEQIEIPLAVDAALADGGGLARRHCIVEMNAVDAASFLVLRRVDAALARRRPAKARGGKFRGLSAIRGVGLGRGR